MRWSRRSKVLLIAACAALALVGAVVLLAGTRSFNEFFDRRALSLMGGVALRAPAAPGPFAAPYEDAAALERLTRPPAAPLTVSVEPLGRFTMSEPGLVQERLSFPSAIAVAHGESNVARAYVYRHGRLGERPVVLWVPGQYVIDLAMIPIAGFTQEIVRQGADVVFLVPPYHLDRTPAGFASGDAVFATSIADHLTVFAQELSDIRRLAGWLRAQGVTVLGGFGGSVGAMLLFRVAGWDASFDFLTGFIPMIRMADVLDGPASAGMRRRLARDGISVARMKSLYASLDPTDVLPRTPRARISVLYGRYDIVAGVPQLLDWAQAWGVDRMHPFDRGHALALFSRDAYRDYARVLAEDLRALGQGRSPRSPSP